MNTYTYNSPKIETGLHCGDSFGEQELQFACKQIVLKRGTDQLLSYPLDFSTSAGQFAYSEIQLTPGGPQNIKWIDWSDAKMVVITVYYDKNSQTRRCKYQREFDSIASETQQLESVLIDNSMPVLDTLTFEPVTRRIGIWTESEIPTLLKVLTVKPE
jgi:hypothetical protein